MAINGITSSLKEVTCGRLYESLQGSLPLISLKMQLPVEFLGQQKIPRRYWNLTRWKVIMNYLWRVKNATELWSKNTSKLGGYTPNLGYCNHHIDQYYLETMDRGETIRCVSEVLYCSWEVLCSLGLPPSKSSRAPIVLSAMTTCGRSLNVFNRESTSSLCPGRKPSILQRLQRKTSFNLSLRWTSEDQGQWITQNLSQNP